VQPGGCEGLILWTGRDWVDYVSTRGRGITPCEAKTV